MNKFLTVSMAFVLFMSIMLPAFECTANTNIAVNEIGKENKKVINIVYDDSGSMINGAESDVTKSDAYVATWAQAKYYLEVFTAMLNVEDELNIYCMSDSGSLSKTIKGADKKYGVSDIHSNLKTGDYSVLTPVQTLKSAYDGLSDKKYDDFEKWLVVLTDGAFTVSNSSGEKVKDSEIESLFSSYGESLNGRLIYIPIGSCAAEYTGNSYKVLKATTGEEILNQVKTATEYIYYERDKKEVTDASINLGVSMKKIIVFAQGAGVEIESTSKGKITDNVSVKYTEAANAVEYSSNQGESTFKGNEDKIKTDDSLQGVVITIEPNSEYIEPGQLNIIFGDISPKTYTIYYEPAVKTYFSLEKDGVEYLSSENETAQGSLNPGIYKLSAYIADEFEVDANTGKPVNVSDAMEIQDIAFDVILSGSGVENGSQSFSYEQLANGIDVNLLRGKINCDSNASILNGKYGLDTENMKNAFSDIMIKDTYRLEIKYEKPTSSVLSYRFSKTNFALHSLDKIKNKEDMIKAIVTCYDNEGNVVEITDELWSQVTIQTLQRYDDDTCIEYDENCYDFHTENGLGVFYLCPRYWKENDKANKKKTTHTNYINRNELCTVRCEIYIDVSDSLAYSTLGTDPELKSTTYEISLCMWHTIIFLIVFFWIFFCVFKKRLPKVKAGTLKNTACFRKELNRRGSWEWVKAKPFYYEEPSTVYITRKLSTVIIPFKPQRGEISLGLGLPKLKIEATEMFGKRSRVRLINSPSDFELVNGKTNIDSDSLYLTIKGSKITKSELLAKKKKKFEFSTSQSVIAFGGNDGGIFRKYTLIFKKKANKKKGMKK